MPSPDSEGELRRRRFLGVLGGAAAWPVAARAQQADRVRRVGLLSPFSENDPETLARLAAFQQRLQDLGWTEGRNIQIEYRFSGGNTERTRAAAAELVALV